MRHGGRTMDALQRASFLAAGWIVLGCVATLPVRPGDSDLVVTAERLAEFGLELPDDYRSFESVERERSLGVTSIEYELDLPDSGPPCVYSLVEVHPRGESACASLWAVNLGLRLGGLEVEDQGDGFAYGERSRFGIIANDGSPVGNVFLMCRGRSSILVMFVGLYFDQPEAWREFISPLLDRLEANQDTVGSS